MSTTLGAFVFKSLEHDLNFRSATFAPNLDLPRPKSLAGALARLGDRNDVEARWESTPIDEIVANTEAAVDEELTDQLGHHSKFADYREKFLQGFGRVEYLVNLRLLHALHRVPDRLLLQLFRALLGGDLPGSRLQLGSVRRPKSGGKNDYHVAQDDGHFVGDEALVALEIKTRGKSRVSKMDAAQLAKHWWMLRTIDAPTIPHDARRLLVILPEAGGKPTGYATDLHLEGGSFRLRGEGNKPFHKFRHGLPEGARGDVEADLKNRSATVITFTRLVEVASGVLRSGDPVLSDLRKVRHLAQPVEGA